MSAVQIDVAGGVQEVDDEFYRLACDDDETLADGHSFGGPASVDHIHDAAAGHRDQGSVARQQAEVSVDTGQAHRPYGAGEDQALGRSEAQVQMAIGLGQSVVAMRHRRYSVSRFVCVCCRSAASGRIGG